MANDDMDMESWRSMARALTASIFNADITPEQKEAIFMSAMSMSPRGRSGDAMEFERMLIQNAVRDDGSSEWMW